MRRFFIILVLLLNVTTIHCNTNKLNPAFISLSSIYDASQGKYIVLDSKKTFYSQISGNTNTIFEVRDRFDLKGETINIPKGCILLFRGGALINGHIIGNNTIIEAPNYLIFSNKCTLTGSFGNTTFNADWFEDLQSAVDIATDNSGIVLLSAREYKLKNSLKLKKGITLLGCGNEGAFRDKRGTILQYNGSEPVVSICGTVNEPVKNVTIKNLKIRGNGKDFTPGTNVGIYIGPKAYYSIFENVSLYSCSNGIEMDNAWNLRFESVNPYYCVNGYFLNGKTRAPLTTSLFSTCVVYNSEVGFNMAADMNAVTFESCGTDGCATSMELAGCFGVSVVSYEFERHTKCGIHIDNSDCYVTFEGLCPRGLSDQTATLIKIDRVGRATFNEMYISNAVAPKKGLCVDVQEGYASKVTFNNAVIKGTSRNLERCNIFNSECKVRHSPSDLNNN